MIDFLMDNTLWFLVSTAVGYFVAIALQLNNMRLLAKNRPGGVLGGFMFVVVFGFIGSMSMLALIVSVILNAIKYFQG